jgi:hypothetical protein
VNTLNDTIPADTYRRVNRAIKAAVGADWWYNPIIVHEVAPLHNGTLIIMGSWHDNETLDPTGRNVPSRLFELLESIPHVAAVWYDEYSTCMECYAAIRTKPDSYSWAPRFIATEYGYVCAECVNSDPDHYLVEYIISADDDDDDPVEFKAYPDFASVDGWTRVTDAPREAGQWYSTSDDDPRRVLAAVRSDYPDHDVMFRVESREQFSATYHAYVREAATSV